MPRIRSTASSPIMSASDLAQALAVDRHTVVDTWIPAGCPVARQANKDAGIAWGFRLADVWRWAIEGGMDADDQADGGGADYESARARKTLAQAQLAELRLEVMRGRLVELDDVADTIRDEYARVRGRLLSLPAAIAMAVVGIGDAQEVERSVKSSISTALEELAADALLDGDEEPVDDEDDVQEDDDE